MPVSEYVRSYNSFSGVDIKATFGGSVVGEIQGISYSVTREKVPVYTMGSADPDLFLEARGASLEQLYLLCSIEAH